MKAIEKHCGGKVYADFPVAFKAFITGLFKSVDVDGMWPCVYMAGVLV